MKKKMNYLVLCALGFVLSWTFPSTLKAQTEPQGHLNSVTEFTVKPGHEMQFREGVKAWKACYLENKGDWTWRMSWQVLGTMSISWTKTSAGQANN